MALGFGFNKQRSQAAAEKYVQQGKLQNAIAEYEKIVQEDAKDLNVMNTIGDLYVRLGENPKAAQCFKKIGESYTSDGYTLKAIAIYKKLAKLIPDDREVSLKLAELFTQQGLYTEARSQYMHLAEQYLRAQDLTQAVRVFQKMLEIDPDNTSIQSKLAELLMKTGKPQEAKEIFSRTAGVLRARGDNAAAKQVLDKLLQLDAANPDALALKGMLAAEAGDYRTAIGALQKVPNLDSVPGALHALLKAYLQTGALDSAEPLAQSLLDTHKDISGLALFAQALLDTGDYTRGLQIYGEYAAQFATQNKDALIQALQGAISGVKDSAAGLELLRGVYQQIGESTYNNEVLELLAHAYVQEGKLDKAAQLYQELAAAEPENPLHAQNYKQIIARLGSDPIYRPPSVEEGNQAFMIEELEDMSRPLPQQHSPELEDRIQAALTESELFSSYNLPEKAISPLESALAVAPYDIQLNQRLASLYTRTKRFADAADRCEVLAQVYGAAGHQEEAQQYADFVHRYRGGPAPAPQAQMEEISLPEDAWQAAPAAAQPSAPVIQQLPQPATPPEGSVKEFEFEVVQEQHPAPQEAAPAAPPPQPSTHEIDLSNEWESMLTTEAAEPAAPPAAEPATVLEMPIPRPAKTMPSEISQAKPVVASKAETAQPESAPPRMQEPTPAVDPAPAPVDTFAERVEEISFYLSQSMLEESRAAIAKLEADAPAAPQLEQLKSRLSTLEAMAKPAKPKIDVKAAVTKTPAPPARTPTPIKPPEVKPAPAAAKTPAARTPQPEFEDLLELSLEEAATEPTPATRPAEKHPPEKHGQLIEIPLAAKSSQQHPKLSPRDADLLEEIELPVAEKGSAEGKDILGNLASDLSASLDGDFLETPPLTASRQPSQKTNAPAKSKDDARTAVARTSASDQKKPGKPPVEPAVARVSAEKKTSAPTADAAAMLAELFDEFKEDVEQQTADDKDLDTHYNLGMAFREMGLLDEAIGELQKVCNAIEKGAQFEQVIQAYTWLAQCLMERGFPEAAVRWYERALKIPHIEADSLIAIYYDLASAHEKAGNKKAAADNYMQACSMNIDYRDVVEKIKALQV